MRCLSTAHAESGERGGESERESERNNKDKKTGRLVTLNVNEMELGVIRRYEKPSVVIHESIFISFYENEISKTSFFLLSLDTESPACMSNQRMISISRSAHELLQLRVFLPRHSRKQPLLPNSQLLPNHLLWARFCRSAK